MRKRYQKQIEHRLLLPILQFTQREKSSGIVLAVFVVLALLLANSPLRSDYLHFLEHHFYRRWKISAQLQCCSLD